MKICNDHFRGECFTTPKHDKLLRNAIPIHHEQEDKDIPEFDKTKLVTRYEIRNFFNISASPPHVFQEESIEDVTEEQEEEEEEETSHEFEGIAVENVNACNDRLSAENDNTYNDHLPAENDNAYNAHLRAENDNAYNARLRAENDNAYNARLRAENDRLRLLVHKKNAQLSANAAVMNNIEDNIYCDTDKFLDHHGVTKDIRRTMIKMQLRPDSSWQAPYSKEEMELAIKWHYHNASGYEKMRLAGLMLPHIRSVEKQIAKTAVYPGFINSVLENLKEELKNLPEQARICVAKVDVMDTMKLLEYDSKMDIIEGFEDLGHLGRTQRLATKLVTVTLNGLDPLHRWRALILYILVHNDVCSEDMVTLMRESLDKAEECGAEIKLFVCDQGEPNRVAYAQLGVTEEQPFFEHHGKAIFAIHDFCNVVKNIVDAWKEHVILIVEGEEVSFEDVITTWEADRNNKLSNTLGYIPADYFSPNNFERQSVRLAFQMMSRKLTNAMKAAKTAKILTSETADRSIWFVDKMDVVIDVCNSSNIFDKNPMKRPLSAKNPGCIEVLEDFLKWGPTIEVRSEITGNLTRLSCFKSLVGTVKGLLGLYRNIVAVYVNFQLLTYICSQDALEVIFSKIRARNGFNSNPSCRMIRLTLRHMVAARYLEASKRGNVAGEKEFYLPAITTTQMKQQLQKANDPEETNIVRTITFFETSSLDGVDTSKQALDAMELIATDDATDNETYNEDNDNEREEQAKEVDVQTSSPFNELSGTLEEISVEFFAGYTAYKTVKQYKCDRCLDEMQERPVAEDVNERYIECREYDTQKSWQLVALRRATEKFRNIVTANLQTFVNNFSLRKQQKTLKESLMKQAFADMLSVCPEWYAEEDPCYQHRLFATNILFTAKLHRQCSLETRAERGTELPKRSENAAKRKQKAKKKKISNNKSKKRPLNGEEEESDEDQLRGVRSGFKHSAMYRNLKIMKHK